MAPNENVDAIPAEIVAEDYFKALHKAYEQMYATFVRLQREDGLTQEAIVRRLGIDKSLVSRRLHGRSNLTFRTMSALATAMDCELEISFKPYKDLAGASPVPLENDSLSFELHGKLPQTVASAMIRRDVENPIDDEETSTPRHGKGPLLTQEVPVSIGTRQSHRIRSVTREAA